MSLDSARAILKAAPACTFSIDDVQPMQAHTASAPFSRAGWAFELKYDGYRLLFGKEGGQPRLRYRSGLDAAALFPEVYAALEKHLPLEQAILDGEVLVPDEQGRALFKRLQERAQLRRASDIARAVHERPALVYAFDLLALDGRDLRALPLSVRKQLLRELLQEYPLGCVRYADHVEERGVELFAEARKLGLEGLVGKRLDSPYRAGRSGDWLKIKSEHSGDFVIIGYTLPKRSRIGFGALHLGLFAPGGALVYVGRVGSGFSGDELAALRAALDAEKLPRRPPMRGEEPLELSRSVWVRPTQVVEVRYLNRTSSGALRAPVFLRLRPDKAASECRDEDSE